MEQNTKEGTKQKCAKIAAVTLFLVWSIALASVLYKHSTPNPDSYSLNRENKHHVIAKNGIFTLETSGGNIAPDQNGMLNLQSETNNFLSELGNANSFPLILKWFLKFDITLSLKEVSIENSNIKVIPEVLCNNILSPNLVIFSQKAVHMEDFLLKVKTSLPEILNSCAINLSANNGTSLPNEYIAKESYTVTIKPVVLNNYLLLFFVSILGSLALLPLLKEGVRFYKEGFNYFK